MVSSDPSKFSLFRRTRKPSSKKLMNCGVLPGECQALSGGCAHLPQRAAREKIVADPNFLMILRIAFIGLLSSALLVPAGQDPWTSDDVLAPAKFAEVVS